MKTVAIILGPERMRTRSEILSSVGMGDHPKYEGGFLVYNRGGSVLHVHPPMMHLIIASHHSYLPEYDDE